MTTARATSTEMVGDSRDTLLDKHYAVYGLHVIANGPVPGLREMTPGGHIDVRLWLGSMPPWVDEGAIERNLWRYGPTRDEAGIATLSVWETRRDWFHLIYADGTEFLVRRCGTEVWARWPATLTVEDTATYLLGPVLGFVLTLRGFTCLHASAVAIGDRAVGLMGVQSAGKSTTAAAFAQSGFSVLTDDVMVVSERTGGLMIEPGYPRLRLWPDSVRMLYGSPDALELLTPNWDKRYLDLGSCTSRFQCRGLPLAALYILGERSNGATAPSLHEISASAGMMALVTNSYVNYLKDRATRAKEFDTLTRIVSTVPVRQVTPHSNPLYLRKICDLIIADLQGAVPHPAPRGAEGFTLMSRR